MGASTEEPAARIENSRNYLKSRVFMPPQWSRTLRVVARSGTLRS
jgi:hypothetical protein